MARIPASLTPESLIIEALQARCAVTRDDIVLGIGDDGAVTRPPAGCELVIATDVLVEGTHFLAAAPARSLGHRCLAVNLSDLAAMSAEPLWATLTLTLPAYDPAWVDEFAAGFAALARRFGVALIGGDTVRGPCSVGVTLVGNIAPGRYVSRSGARPGDDIWITAAPGRACAGRLLLAGELPTVAEPQRYIECFYYPEPRVAFGRQIAAHATAMLDVSDGLATDLQRLLSAGGVGADAGVPLAPELRSDFGSAQGVQLCLHGGEDYELLFTAPPAARAPIADCGAATGLTPLRLGVVTSTAGLRWSLDGQAVNSASRAFEHFPNAGNGE